MFGRKKRRKLKFPKLTLEDCTEDYRKNHEYRYVVVVGMDRAPIELCKSIESARDSVRGCLMSDCKLPVYVIDLERECMM